MLEILGHPSHTHSGLIPASFTTLAHFSVSSAINLAKSARDIAISAPPRSARRALIFGSASAGVDLVVEPFDDLGGRALRRADPHQSLAS